MDSSRLAVRDNGGVQPWLHVEIRRFIFSSVNHVRLVNRMALRHLVMGNRLYVD